MWAQLPKAELHVHLEGTLEPAMLLELAERNRVPVPWNSIEDLEGAYHFEGLPHFLTLLFQGARVLRQRRDFYDLTHAYLRRAHQDGVRLVEMFVGPQTFLDADIPLDAQLGGVFDAIEDARSGFGIDAKVLLTAQRHRTEAAALELLDMARPWYDRLLGFGLGGAERGNPPAEFANYYAQCRRLGLRTTIHAGEDGPSDYVREALDVCHPDRIDHGVAAADDPELIKRLVDERIPLTMCPLSNLRLGVTPDLRQHPLRRLQQAGVLVTVNSDDPPYFGGYLNDNYRAIATALDLTDHDVATLVGNGFAASFAERGVVDAALADIADGTRGHARGTS
ncbi:adenine deaminase [Mycolicibacterium madagascariense]|uniref:Adenine deaminase n=1 Tax=Mycolicibacterium madagascariense TaxID=212765 RepID=A0A7I7XM99_9MYCO|nr:adenine deaminase [Mycolicibacterium madagascariense]